jgi:hypothetical protein
MISAANRKRKIAASPPLNRPPPLSFWVALWAFALLTNAVAAGNNNALVARRPLRKDRRCNRLVRSWLQADSGMDGDSLDNSLLLVGLLTVLPRSLVSSVSGEQTVQST